MPVNIHNATTDQAGSLFLILKDVIEPLPYYNEIAKQHELTKYSAKELCKKIEEDPYSVLVAEEDDRIVGFCLSRLDDMTIWLEWFGISEQARGKGLSRLIVQQLEQTAKARNAHKIWCDCRTENKKTINLLSSSGYTPICTLRNHWYKQDFILWQKEIA